MFADYFCIPTLLVLGEDFTKKASDPNTISMLRMLSHCKEWSASVRENVFTDSEMRQIIKYASFLVSNRR